jgi:hypothetical protein
MIKDNNSFKDCGGKMICNLIGGSTLYGLNNESSDIDYRGIFFASNKKYVSGFNTIESIVLTNEIDATYYEISRYLKLLRKSNTQVLEILFAPKKFYVYKHDFFDELINNRYFLIDTNVLKASLKGYVFSEIRLATGERSGQLGGKRKISVNSYGFSPKNFVQILRLCKVGIEFFKSGQYMVNVKEFDPGYYDTLMNIKNNPQDFTCDQLKTLVDEKYKELEAVMESSKIRFKFDEDLASDLILAARNIFK